MQNRSLKASLQITISVLVLIIGLAISQFVTQQYNSVLMEGTKTKVENIAHRLALDSAHLILANDLITLQKEIENQLLISPGVSYVFVENGQQALVHTFSHGIPDGFIGANRPLAAGKGHIKTIISEKGEHFLDIAWPIFADQQIVLRLGLSEVPIRDQVKRLWLQMSLMTGLFILLAIAVIHYLISYLTRPLSTLTNKVEQFNEGNLDTRFDVTGSREVVKLTFAFNNLLTRLKDYAEQLNSSNETLNEKHEELSRAHRQLSTSFAISKEIAGLPKLEDICAYLLKTFRNILTCQQMAFLIFSPKQRLFLFTDYELKQFESDVFEAVYASLKGLHNYEFMKTDQFASLKLPARMADASKIAAFPLKDQEELLGALIIGCCNQCVCRLEELAVVEPILGQSANALKRALALEEELGKLNSTIEQSNEFCGLVGKDPKLQMVFKLIENVATTEASVLIQGESGTGKELVASAIHKCSPRRDKPFVIINCSAYPTTLLESELFGHEKGAFTGATRRKAGRFEQADGGTVFLDEIGEISQSAQIKLLRVLQSRKFELLGGEETLSVNVRVLAATNKDLSEAVRAGTFREDLFYRLNVIPVTIPPLRERRNDIILLARHFLKRFSSEQQKEIQDFSSEAMHYLIGYPWPGNVRELENTIEHAVVLANSDFIEVLDLPTTITSKTANNTRAQSETLSESEEHFIRKALEECGGNKSKAAEKIGISRGTLYQKIRKYNIVSN